MTARCVVDAQRPLDFSGPDYVPELDRARLTKQREAIRVLMSDGRWRTLAAISDAVGGAPQASVSAQLRHLRKPEYGSHRVDKRRCGEPTAGLFEYRVLPGEPS